MGLDRRHFSLAGIYGLWALMGAALGIPAVIYLFAPPRTKDDGGYVDAGEVARLKTGQPEEVIFRRKRVDGWKVLDEKNTAWVVKKSDREVIAFGPQCTHLGCAYTWLDKTKEFLCPCHTSTFSIEGAVLTGPAPRALDRMDVKIAGGKLLIGAIRRSENA